MKITFVLPSLAKGDGIRVVGGFAEQLKKRGHDVTAIAPPDVPATLGARMRAVVEETFLSQDGQRQPSYFEGTAVPLTIADQAGPISEQDVCVADAVVATCPQTAQWVAGFHPDKGEKFYFVCGPGVHEVDLEDAIAAWRLPLFKITSTQRLATLITEHVGFRPVAVMPYAVESKTFFADQRRKQAEPTVGFFYRGGPSAGDCLAIDALRLARLSVPGLRLVMYGSEELPAVWRDLGTYHRLVPTEELRDIYASCDAWLFPCHLEGCELPISEAMACRTPVISTPAGAAPELLAEGRGIVVSRSEPEALAAAIVRVCDMSEDQWKAMSERAHDFAQGQTWEKAGDRFEEVFRQVAPCPDLMASFTRNTGDVEPADLGMLTRKEAKEA